ncbi:MAG: class I SAM-dependent methyltransferase [Peptococcaceae bacterium]|nr:class I SAM-dependent methyltransferase [Peptococcaceae bacterium]
MDSGVRDERVGQAMRELDKHVSLFNRIARVYNWFFQYQVKKYTAMLGQYHSLFKLPVAANVLDIGCGTGALLYSFARLGYHVTGVDAAAAMIDQAKISTQSLPIEYYVADATKGLPFASHSFDLVIASYVMHGFKYDLRSQIYQEARRLTRGQVVFYDYNHKRRLVTDIVEWAERGDYFNFIEHAAQEMHQVFKAVEVIDVAPQTALYICSV